MLHQKIPIDAQASLRVTDHTLYHLMRRASVDSVVTLYQAREGAVPRIRRRRHCVPPADASPRRAPQPPGNTLKREGTGELPWRMPRGSGGLPRGGLQRRVLRRAPPAVRRADAPDPHPAWRRRNGSMYVALPDARVRLLRRQYAASPLTRRACTMPDPPQPPSPPPPPPADACGLGLRAFTFSERLQRHASPWSGLPAVLCCAARLE